MSDTDPKKDIQYRGGHLDDEDQEKAAAEKASHEDDVSHVQYRGAEDDIKLHEKHEKKPEHVKYRGAEDDVDL